MLLDQENFNKKNMHDLEAIGRYPHGFRHYENFANYSQVKRDATIQEYMEEMNRPCEFHEYMTIMRQHMIEESQTPDGKQEFKTEVIRELNRAMKINR